MKRILVYGLKEPIGGVEKVVLSYASHFPSEDILCDYLIFGNDFSCESEIQRCGGTVFYLPNRIKHRKAYTEKLRSIFAEQQYDAVWANFSGLTNIDMLKLAKRFGVPIRVAHSHCAKLYWTGRLMRYLVPLFHYINKSVIHRYATHFWACSDLAGTFMFPSVTHNKLTVIRNAVDTACFFADEEKRSAMRKQLGIEDAFVVGHIARMSAEKNQSFMLDVFKDLHDCYEKARLLFVGDGELRSLLMDKAKELGIANEVIFTGFQTDVADYYRASDVFLMPSTSEGLGLSLIEAQACGVPCVASDAVPREADVTGYVRFLHLDEPIKKWSDTLLEFKNVTIPNAVTAVNDAGYGLDAEAKKVGDFFCGKSFEEI